MSIEQLTAVLGWCTIINVVFLFLAFFVVTLIRDPVAHLHARLFGFNHKDIPALYFEYLGRYKLLILMFNLVPYVAIKIVL